MATPNTQAIARPARDEWGVYDPEQAGLAALYARLAAQDSVTPPPAPEKDAATQLLARPSLGDAK